LFDHGQAMLGWVLTWKPAAHAGGDLANGQIVMAVIIAAAWRFHEAADFGGL
jgi:hypothetical protein